MRSEVAGGLFALAWILGWLAFGVVFAIRWQRQRREDPQHTPPYFPWDRVLITGLFLWWLFFIIDVRDWLVRRRKGP